MALDKQAIELPLGIGVDESTQKELLDPNAAVLVAHNVALTKHGVYTKRQGLSLYNRNTIAGGAITAGFSVHDFDEAYPVITDGSKLYDYGVASNTWVERDYVPEAVVTRISGLQPPPFGYIYQFDSVVVAGYRLTIATQPRGSNADNYEDLDNTNYSDLYVQVSDVASGAVVYGPTLLSQVYAPGVSASLTVATTPNGYAVVTAQTTVRTGSPGVVQTSQLALWVFNLGANPTAAPTLYSFENYTAPGTFNIATIRVAIEPATTAGGNPSLIYFRTSIGGTTPTITFHNFDPSNGVYTNTASPITNVFTPGYFASQVLQIQYDSASNRLWMFWRDDAGTPSFRVATLNATTFAIVVPSTQFPQPGAASSPSVHTVSACLGEVTSGTGRDLWVTRSESLEGGTTSAVRCHRVSVVSGAFVFTKQFPATSLDLKRANVSAFSDPFNRSGRWYQWFVTTPWIAVSVDRGTSQRNAVLCEVRDDVSTLRPVANVAPLLISTTNTPRFPHRVFRSSTDVYETPVPVVRNATVTHVELASVDFADKRRLMSAQFGDVLALSAGSPSFFDGEQVMEQGFIAPPSIDVTDITWVSGSPKWVAGTYSFFAVWAHVDARGNIHRSAPSNIVTKTYASDRIATIGYSPLAITGRNNGVKASSARLEVYQTRTNEGTFYLGSTFPATTTSGASATIDSADKNQLFYSQPGVPGAAQFRYPPPPLRCLIQHNGSLCGIAEDGRTIWFSGQHVPGEGVWWNPAFVAYVDDPSVLTALASMDGRLFAFTRNSIYAIDGGGFADNGEGGYAPPLRIAADAGCISERSVVVAPVGILFQTDLGIQLLTRSGELVAFGRMVEDTLAAYPRVTSAVLSRTTGEVRFTCTTQAAGGNSVWLIYDYRNQAWFTGAPSISGSQEIVSACVSSRGALSDSTKSSAWHMLTADGVLAYVNPAQKTDGTFPYTQVVETGWVKVAGLQGFQRIWRVLVRFRRAIADGGLRVSLFYDGEVVASELRVWSAAELSALPREQVEIHCKRQKCQTMKIRLESTVAGLFDGSSVDFLGLRLIVGVKGKTPMGGKFR